ncbi:hypothetical protein GCM10017750_01160 [Streptomyces racemochromogenes]
MVERGEGAGVEGGAGGVEAGGAVDPTAGVGGGGGEVETRDRSGGPAAAGYRAEDQLLVEVGGALVDGAAGQRG